MEQKNIQVPDKLTLLSVDGMYSQLQSINFGECAVFDLSNVKFVTPEALVLLVTASDLFHKKTGQVIMWKNANPNVRSYMDRMNINDLPFVSLEHPSFFKKRQYTKSNALIELSTIANSQEIGRAIIRTKEILNQWFPNSSTNYVRNLSTLFKESFENSIEHSSPTPSNGFCYYALQKYTRSNNTPEIQIAVGDIGIGILASQKECIPQPKMMQMPSYRLYTGEVAESAEMVVWGLLIFAKLWNTLMGVLPSDRVRRGLITYTKVSCSYL